MDRPATTRLTKLQRERILRKGIASAFEETALRPLLSKVVKHACLLLGADDGGVGLVGEGPRRVVMEAVHNLPEGEIGSAWLPGEGIAGQVLASGKPVVINRYGDIDPQQRAELAENAVVGVPITRRKKMVGFLGIGAKAPRKFGPEDTRVLSQFAGACAAAIENARLFEETQRNLEQTQLLYETTTRLSQARTLDDVVKAYLSHIASGRTYTSNIVLYDTDDQGRKTFNVAVGSWRPGIELSLEKSRIAHEPDRLDARLERGETLRFSDVSRDRRAPEGLRREQEKDGHPALVLIPLMSRRRRIGLVALALPYPHDWTDEELQPFLVTSAHLAAAIDIRIEQERLAEERAALALVEDRKRLARDLHDSVTQTLFAIQLFSQSMLDDPGPGVPAKAQNVADLSRSGLKEMRALLAELRPVEPGLPEPRPDAQDLAARLRRHARDIGLEAQLDVIDERQGESRPEIEHALFRIAQEALSNAHKHASATSVSVRLGDDTEGTRLEVVDDGRGLRKAPASRKTLTLGMVGMQERAVALGGTFQVDSKPGKGTALRVRIPKDAT